MLNQRSLLKQGLTRELCSERSRGGGSSLLLMSYFDVAVMCSKAMYQFRGSLPHAIQ